MNETYTKGRWTASIAPSDPPRYSLAPADGDDEHIATVTYTGEDTLPNPQQMTGWAPESMFENLCKYVDERDAADRVVELVDEPADETPATSPEQGCGERNGGWTCQPWACTRRSECLLDGLDDEPGPEELDSGEQDRHRPDACQGCTYLPGPDYGTRISSSPTCPIHGQEPAADPSVLRDVAELRDMLGDLVPGFAAVDDWARTARCILDRIEQALQQRAGA